MAFRERVWVDHYGYALVVRATASGFELFDPQENAVDSTWATLDDAENELAQDEFSDDPLALLEALTWSNVDMVLGLLSRDALEELMGAVRGVPLLPEDDQPSISGEACDAFAAWYARNKVTP
jgi:hypothetical protein